MSAPLLDIEGMSVRRAGALAVDDVSLTLGAGEVVALLGANGAGKTSLLRAIIGLERASAGILRLDGRAITRVPAHRRAELGIGYCPEGRRLFPGLTVAETLDAAGPAARGERQARIAEMHALFPQLAEKADELAWRLSGGQQQMLAIARALMAAPRVLLLDEPSLGLAPVVLGEVLAVARRLADERGTAVLLAEQASQRALSIADRAVVMRRGKIVLDRSAAEARGADLANAVLG